MMSQTQDWGLLQRLCTCTARPMIAALCRTLGLFDTFGWQEGHEGGNLGKKGQELSPPAPISPIEILLWL